MGFRSFRDDVEHAAVLRVSTIVEPGGSTPAAPSGMAIAGVVTAIWGGDGLHPECGLSGVSRHGAGDLGTARHPNRNAGAVHASASGRRQICVARTGPPTVHLQRTSSRHHELTASTRIATPAACRRPERHDNLEGEPDHSRPYRPTAPAQQNAKSQAASTLALS